MFCKKYLVITLSVTALTVLVGNRFVEEKPVHREIVGSLSELQDRFCTVARDMSLSVGDILTQVAQLQRGLVLRLQELIDNDRKGVFTQMSKRDFARAVRELEQKQILLEACKQDIQRIAQFLDAGVEPAASPATLD